MLLNATFKNKVYQSLAHGRWFSPGIPASSTTKTGRHDIAEILLKVALKHQINNISVISWRSVLLVEEPGGPGEYTRPADKLYHIILYRVHIAWAGFELTTLVVIGIDCIGSCKSNHHIITATMAPTDMELFSEMLSSI